MGVSDYMMTSSADRAGQGPTTPQLWGTAEVYIGWLDRRTQKLLTATIPTLRLLKVLALLATEAPQQSVSANVCQLCVMVHKHR